MGGRLGGGRTDSLRGKASICADAAVHALLLPLPPPFIRAGHCTQTWKKLRGWPEDGSHRPLSTANWRSPGDTSTPSLCSST